MIEGGKKPENQKKHIVGMLVRDEPGVLSKISGLFSRRGFNIDTIIVGKTNLENVSHVVVSLFADDKTIEQLDKQVYKLIDVVKLSDFNETDSVVREHCLAKVSSSEKTRKDLVNICKLNNANVLNMNHKSIIVEMVGEPKKIDSFIKLLSNYGIKELSRTGINALQRE
jgi:acetolactate synthase I/III small subunit